MKGFCSYLRRERLSALRCSVFTCTFCSKDPLCLSLLPHPRWKTPDWRGAATHFSPAGSLSSANCKRVVLQNLNVCILIACHNKQVSLLKQTNSDQTLWLASWLSKGFWSQGPTPPCWDVIKHTRALCGRHEGIRGHTESRHHPSVLTSIPTSFLSSTGRL